MQYVPQTGINNKPLATWLIVLVGSFLVMSLIVSAPLTLAAGNEWIAYNIYLPFSYVCHQIPARSFFITQHPFAVCSRCTGIYAGFLIGVSAYPLLRSLRHTEAPTRKWLFVAAIPLAIDFSLEFFGIWNNTHFSRFTTGALLGGVAVFYVLPGLIELSLRESRHSVPLPVTTTSAAESSVTNVSSGPSDYSAPHRRI
jgi:uncharacterized membrane protein